MLNSAQIFRRASKIKRLATELRTELESSAEEAEGAHSAWLMNLAGDVQGIEKIATDVEAACIASPLS